MEQLAKNFVIPSEAKDLLFARSSEDTPHAYEIFPKIAGRLAPVADGTFDGRRCHVS